MLCMLEHINENVRLGQLLCRVKEKEMTGSDLWKDDNDPSRGVGVDSKFPSPDTTMVGVACSGMRPTDESVKLMALITEAKGELDVSNVIIWNEVKQVIFMSYVASGQRL